MLRDRSGGTRVATPRVSACARARTRAWGIPRGESRRLRREPRARRDMVPIAPPTFCLARLSPPPPPPPRSRRLRVWRPKRSTFKPSWPFYKRLWRRFCLLSFLFISAESLKNYSKSQRNYKIKILFIRLCMSRPIHWTYNMVWFRIKFLLYL